MTETKKIALACAVGGAIGTAVALMVAAAFWWLGLLAGFCAGYVSYEFRAVLRAIPEALRETSGALADFFGEAHPIMYPSFGVFLLGMYGMVVHLHGWKPGTEWVRWPLGFIAAGFAVLLFHMVLATAYRRRYRAECGMNIEDAMGLMVDGDWEYRDVLVMFLTGMGIVTWGIITFPFRFLVALIRLIHSDKRLLCGLDSALGTGVVYLTLIRPHQAEMTAGQMVVALVATAAMSAVLGIVNYEVVSKRWLHLDKQRS